MDKKEPVRFPGVLWLLPIVFGFVGGIIAGLIASLKYEASWWELVAVGAAISLFALGGYLILVSVYLTSVIGY